MKIKIIILVLLTGLLIIGIRGCYLRDYKTVLEFSEKSSIFYISPDSVTVAPYFFVENSNTLAAVVDFKYIKDSLLLESLNVTVFSNEYPNQSVKLRYITIPVRPLSGTNGSLERLSADDFDDLPLYYKTIRNSGLPYNSIVFLFRAGQMKRTRFFNFKITGKALYKGQVYYFEKDVKAERKVKYEPYRMMT